jgi:hypothetical protein
MMYDFGTGVEELAFAAQSFGYKGALPFYGGDLSTLASELAEGRPVVVSLGAKGEGQPGHFVTVTGISPDGSWIAYNDPTLGEQVLPASEFLRLWGLQGNSGVVVAPALPPAAPDPMPWVALAAGMMALVSTTPLGLRRKGIGGRITAETGTGSSKSAAPKPAPKSAPKPASKPAPKPAAPSRSSAPAKYGKEPPPPPKPTPKPTPPTDYAEEARSARAEDRLARVSVSTPQTRFDAETPTPAPTQKPTETPAPPGRATATPEPVVTLTPTHPEEVMRTEPSFPPTGDVALAARLARLGYSAYRAGEGSAVTFNPLPSGYYSISVAADRVAVGERIAFRTELGYAGTRYGTAGLANATAEHVLDAANSRIAVGLAVGVPVAVNLYDYGVGDHSDVGIRSPEFAASTLVDVGKSAAVGLAAAGAVALGVVIAAALGVTAVATAPAWGIALAVAGAGLLIGGLVEAIHLPDGREGDEALKEEVTQGLEAWGDIFNDAGDLID